MHAIVPGHIDDVVVMRFDEDRFLVSTLFPTYMDDWFYDHKKDFDVDWCEITDEWHMFSVQGPRAKELVESITDEPMSDILFFQHKPNSIHGIPVIINRGGFTGEKLSYEIYASLSGNGRG